MILPASVQSITGWLCVLLIFPDPFPVLAPVQMIFFGAGFSILIWLIDGHYTGHFTSGTEISQCIHSPPD